jgi:predicted enzyme related to lactoylglutathione lyase
MIDRDGYPHGVPCWVDTTQPDPEAAARFYGALFGWEFEPRTSPGAGPPYLVARLDGRDVAALTGGAAASSADWRTYVWVDDADATAAKIAETGGTVDVAPTDVGDHGRTAAFTDPTGAGFRVWQAGTHRGAAIVNAAGSWNWSDLNTDELESARDFYAAVFGWQATAVDFGFGESWMWRVPGYAEFLERRDPGLRRRHADAGAPEGFSDAIGWLLPAGGGPSRWAVTFSAGDTDATAEHAARLGGEVVTAPYDAGPTRAAVLKDPQGAVFAISTYTPAS